MATAGVNVARGGRIEAALAVQRAFMDTYGDSLEQLLGCAVYMIPIQDAEDDLAGFSTQCVYSIIDLFSLYRTVLLRKPEALPLVLEKSTSDVLDKARLQSTRLVYTVAAFSLRVLRSVQVLLEMQAKRAWGAQHALRVCLRVEFAKLCLKLLMRSKMPFNFYIDEDALEAYEPPASKLRRNPLAAELPSADNEPPVVGRRSGRTLRALENGAAGRNVGPGAGEAGPSAVPPVIGLLNDRSPASPQMLVAEAIFHTRPLVHLAVLLRRGPSSWAAWLVAFLLDRCAMGLLVSEVRPQVEGQRAQGLEWAELARRRSLMWWAFARSPVFEKFLKRPAETLERVWKKIPFLNLFNVIEMALALQPFYFSTSAS